MKKILFTDLNPEQQANLQKILDMNRLKPTKTQKVKTEFTKHELEQNYKRYLRY